MSKFPVQTPEEVSMGKKVLGGDKLKIVISAWFEAEDIDFSSERIGSSDQSRICVFPPRGLVHTQITY